MSVASLDRDGFISHTCTCSQGIFGEMIDCSPMLLGVAEVLPLEEAFETITISIEMN